ncbi:hypothetical protein L5G32_09010 [Gordonia sp. HY002]|uniref:hypothetical protein n=1 Tax=Gordonia zhenghanii TaxID=2911516 RepID=UPI001EF058DA|nr:hypothetical protein [Gordonia zhenghanii]MCF8570403.1 hypothetical protein [Gordonia zhenghanii]MCF8604633.1 hypothetical protein [Gordonia zhenghanii]
MMEKHKHDSRDLQPTSDLSDIQWTSIARQVVRILRSIDRQDLQILRANNTDTELYVVFKNFAAGGNAATTQGLRYDVRKGNYDGEYSGSPEEFTLHLIHTEILEPGYEHPVGLSEIRWKVAGDLPPGPATIDQYDEEFER